MKSQLNFKFKINSAIGANIIWICSYLLLMLIYLILPLPIFIKDVAFYLGVLGLLILTINTFSIIVSIVMIIVHWNTGIKQYIVNLITVPFLSFIVLFLMTAKTIGLWSRMLD